MRRARWLPAFVVCVAACATTQRPAIMAHLEQVRAAPASVQAAEWAPQAHAHALGLEQRANEELAAGDGRAAELLSEQAIAAHEHAWVLTRLAKAEQRKIAAEAQLATKRQALLELQKEQQRLATEAAGLELQTKVVRGALPPPAHGAASPERRAARATAAAAVGTQARLLCMGASLLAGGEVVAGELAELDRLEADLPKRPTDVLERAMRLRQACLTRITQARSSALDAEPADRLLSELSEAGVAPSRDDRGVVVTLRDLFDAQGELAERGRTALSELARAAQAHPKFPVLVVGHTASERERERLNDRIERVRAALSSLGVTRVGVYNAGALAPLLPAQDGRPEARNERIEVVFVAPGA